MAQMVEENKSLWRIKDKYLTDSADCPDCQAFFTKLIQQKEMVISELYELIKTEINK
jgi:protein-arginine kinase activator protein McsA